MKKHVQSELEKRVNNQIKKIDFLFVVEMAVAAKKIADEENSNNQKMSQENAEYRITIFFYVKIFHLMRKLMLLSQWEAGRTPKAL